MKVRTVTKRREHAVVIGGSMAGMLAARVLADYFELVTILERDRYSEIDEHRRGLPQSRHLHALLARGLQIIEELFPGVRDELVASGAQVLDSGSDVAWQTPAGWGKPFKSDISVLSFSRPFLDRHIRARMVDIPNVKIISGCEVTRLVTNSERNAVNGVCVKVLGAEDEIPTESAAMQKEQFLKADLVVDASGRHSRAPQWLVELGYEPPRETIVNAFLGYATRIFERPANYTDTWKAVFLQAAPPELTRAGLMFPIEGNRWILTLCGGDRDYPPSDEQAFFEFAESLPSSLFICDAIRNAKPLSPIRTFRNTQNRLRHYAEMGRLPGQFILIGDSVCAFNPVYGQGMTISAMGAIELRRNLCAWKRRKLDESFVRNFQKQLAKINVLPWALATGEDCRYRGTEGATRTLKVRLMHAYLERVVALTTKDIHVRRVWMTVFQMLKPPTSLFHPKILLKVMREMITRPRQPKTAGQYLIRQPSWASSSRD